MLTTQSVHRNLNLQGLRFANFEVKNKKRRARQALKISKATLMITFGHTA
jgi:hypothetical protein